jgi:hypothetical protein
MLVFPRPLSCRGDFTIFKYAPVDYDISGHGIYRPPDCHAFFSSPDQSLDGLTGIESLQETAGKTTDIFRFAWREACHQGATSETVCAEAVHNRFFETDHFREFSVYVKPEYVTGESI